MVTPERPSTATEHGALMDRPLVSIIIPCYNYGRFLAEAIESALRQTYQPVEVVVVDDGSTDDTAEVAARYPVKLLRQSNAGVPAVMNAGIQASRGSFIVRLDADDLLAPTYVEELLQVLLSHPVAHFAYCSVQYFGAATGTYPIAEFDLETLAERNYVNGSAMIRRSSFETVGGYNVDLTGLRCEDWDLWLSFAERGMSGRMIAKPLLWYRQHPSNTSPTRRRWLPGVRKRSASQSAFTSRNVIELRSLDGIRKEMAIAGRLQDHHPAVFAPRALCARLKRLPGRLLRGQVSLRFAALLLGFYGVMLFRGAFHRADFVAQVDTEGR